MYDASFSKFVNYAGLKNNFFTFFVGLKEYFSFFSKTSKKMFLPISKGCHKSNHVVLVLIITLLFLLLEMAKNFIN